MKDQSYNGTITNDSGDTQMAINKLLREIENKLNEIADAEDAFTNGLLTAAKERFRIAKESIANAYVNNQSLSSSALSTILENCKKLRALVESGLPQQVPTIDFLRATVIFADNVANFVRADEAAPSTQEREAEVPTRDVEEVGLKTAPATAQQQPQQSAKATPYTRKGDYLYFGTYPQTLVTDKAILAALNKQTGFLPTAADAQDWTSYRYYTNGTISDYMWYIDLSYGEEKYRGVYFTQYRPHCTVVQSSAENTCQGKNGYIPGNIYWFKYEPIKWRILFESKGVALILAEMSLDSQEYCHYTKERFSHNGGKGYANNYALSNIRKWLNDAFYNTAFGAKQKALVLKTMVDNSAGTTSDSGNQEKQATNYTCKNTQDNIFLLSEQEVTMPAYGFSGNYEDEDAARRKKNTDYARCQGAGTSTENSYNGNGDWWLRSPGCDTFFARNVRVNGDADGGCHVSITDIGVVPALKISLS